jgi:Fur family ferric uptake transcriptional regulator
MVEFERILRDRGYRLTNQRRVIVRGLEGDRHLSAEEIYDRVKGEHPEIGLSTVYRTLNEELMEYLALQVERETGFVTDWHEITLHGRCAGCAAADAT